MDTQLRKQLSKNFRLDEFLVSQTAMRHDIDMTPPEQVVKNLTRLCHQVLQPLRETVGPTHVISGFRPIRLNRLVGSKDSSQHPEGLAADITVAHISPPQLYSALKCSMLPFDQCILEFDQWVHLSIAAEGDTPRREFLIATRVDGQTRYTRDPVKGITRQCQTS